MILKRLQNVSISNLSNEINNIKVNELYPDSTNKIMLALGNYSITNLTSAFDNLKISDVVDMEKVANASYNPGTDPAYKQYEAQGIWAFIDGNTLLKNFGDVEINLAEIQLGRLQYEGLVDQTLDLTKALDGQPLSQYTLNGFLNEVISSL